VPEQLSFGARAAKRAFDVIASGAGLLVCGPLIVLLAIAARADTRASGIFSQRRVGRYGRVFTVHKLRTMRAGSRTDDTVTVRGDVRVTRLGAWLRRWKLDELPQLWNVFRGDMSFVGPRPDVEGFADALTGDDRVILSIRPGITGPATLAFRNEEELLARQADPIAYNRDVVFPMKVALNRAYVRDYTFLGDLRYIVATVLGRPALAGVDPPPATRDIPGLS
jgi:lipopolysaccharide/colanic/teichoic acid biosynthesis glycosyltransferase